eukprot:5552011-Pleurochrysis_carterae.AAC.4
MGGLLPSPHRRAGQITRAAQVCGRVAGPIRNELVARPLCAELFVSTRVVLVRSTAARRFCRSDAAHTHHSVAQSSTEQHRAAPSSTGQHRVAQGSTQQHTVLQCGPQPRGGTRPVVTSNVRHAPAHSIGGLRVRRLEAVQHRCREAARTARRVGSTMSLLRLQPRVFAFLDVNATGQFVEYGVLLGVLFTT